MIFTTIQCPVCKSNFSVVINVKEKTCSSKECPNCKTHIELEISSE